MPQPLPFTPRSDEPQVHWREYALILRERRWILITTLVVVVTLTLIWTFRQTPIFRASARIKADLDQVKIAKIENVLASEASDWQYLNTLQQLLQTRSLAERVVKALALDQNKDFLPDAKPNADFARALQNCITVKLVRDSRLIDIVAEHRNPQIAAQLANSMADEFINQDIEQKRNKMKATYESLRKEASESQEILKKSDIALQEYREKTGGVSLEGGSNIIEAKLKDLNTRVTAANADRAVAESEWKDLKGRLDAGSDAALSPVIAANAQVAALRKQLNDKQVSVSVLEKRYGPKHPMMIAARVELEEIQKKLAKSVSDAVETVRANYELAKDKEQNLRSELEQQAQLAQDLKRNLIDYDDLKRNSQTNQQAYEGILATMKAADITGKLPISEIHIADPAQVPTSPYKPQKSRNLLLGLVLGLVGGIGLSFLAHYYDDKVKTQDDIESYLRLPLLTSVPTIKLEDALSRSRVTQVEPRSVCSEAFRSLRASLRLSPLADKAKLLLVTSAGPGEGKSLVSSNLAAVFAQNGLRTLLIDADMRRPTIQKTYHIEAAQGLSGFLAGESETEAEVFKTDLPNLDVVVVGKVPPNPPELLGSSRMRELLAAVQERYDRVVIDSPPIHAVSDALLLLPHVNGVIMIVHFNRVRRDIVVRAVQKLRESDVPIFGAVLNNINIEKNGYYYYPYHYSHYYQQERHSSQESSEPASDKKPTAKRT